MIKDIPANAQQPDQWQWKTIARNGYDIRYGYAPAAKENAPIVICLPGLSEFVEKYFETANDLIAQGYGVLVIDWRGQGLSSRYLKNPHKRHSQGFAKDADDLNAALIDCPIITPTSNITMLAHSMGGNIGMHYLDKYPGLINRAILTAPLLGLHIFESIPKNVASLATKLGALIFSKSYAPTGGNWTPHNREKHSASLFSSDPVRGKIHNAWMLRDTSLQVGHITWQWLRDAHQACLNIQSTMDLTAINIPITIFHAGHENFVDNIAIGTVAAKIPNAETINFPEARHEILMEKDTIRSKVFEKLYSFSN